MAKTLGYPESATLEDINDVAQIFAKSPKDKLLR
jgi:hypothetical protein